MTDVICLGEALIDLLPARDADGRPRADTLIRAAGGAPANVAIGLARLDRAVAFVGCVGADAFGRYLADTLGANGVNTTSLVTRADAPTALALVALDADGDRRFTFYGHPAAHDKLTPEDIDPALFAGATMLHFGSISLAREPARSATLRALALAAEHRLRISFDPNYRPCFWPDLAAAQEAMRLGIAHAHVVKLAEAEAELLGGGCDLVECARALWHPHLEAMVVTRGAKGALWLTSDDDGSVAAPSVAVVDTAGAGDAFTAALLACIVGGEGLHRDAHDLANVTRIACAAGAISTTVAGASDGLPRWAAIDGLLARSQV